MKTWFEARRISFFKGIQHTSFETFAQQSCSWNLLSCKICFDKSFKSYKIPGNCTGQISSYFLLHYLEVAIWKIFFFYNLKIEARAFSLTHSICSCYVIQLQTWQHEITARFMCILYAALFSPPKDSFHSTGRKQKLCAIHLH